MLNSISSTSPHAMPQLMSLHEPLAVTETAPAELTTEKDDGKLREAFDAFVGETFFSQMLSSMRKTVKKPAYFHGGRAEEVFQGQLDQIIAQRTAEASAEQFSGPMYELFTLQRPS